MRKIVIHSLVVVSAAALGLATGAAWRRNSTSSPPVESSAVALSAEDSTGKVARATRPGAHARSRDDSPLATQLEHDLSLSSGVTRWLYWFEAIEKAAASDFPRLYAMAEGNGAASRLISQRWIELYPQQLLDTIQAATKKGGLPPRRLLEISHTLFREWSKRDAAAAVAALNGAENFPMRDSWRHEVAGTVIEKDAELGLKLFSEWHIDNYGPRMKGVATWAASDPLHAAEVALKYPAGYASRLVMETIGQEWGKTDPARALEFASGHPGDFSATLASAALKEWAGHNLNAAANWLTTADPRTRNRLSAAFVEGWAKTDANSALAWCESNLTGSSLAQAVGGAVKSAAAQDVLGAATLVVLMEPSAARAEAAAAVAEKWFPRSFDNKPVPAAAVAWMAGLDGEAARRAMDAVYWGWSESDPKSMASFLASSTERFPEQIYYSAVRALARKNPIEGLDWASHLPEERGLDAGAEAFGEWRVSQPEAAAKWLAELPASDPRRAPYFNRAIRFLVWNEQASGPLATLDAPQRAQARDIIKDMSLPADRKNALLEKLK